MTLLSLKDFLNEEKEGPGLTIWDIDETLFMTKAKVYLLKDGKRIRDLANKEYNVYDLKSGESFDFSDFQSAQHFRDTSEPIVKAINKAMAILRNVKKTAASKMIIITARSDFDNKEMFLQTFRDHGFDIDNVYVERAGNLGIGNAAANKRVIIKRYLEKGVYKRVRLFDDAVANLQMLKDLSKEYPDVKFDAFLAHPDGTMTKY